MILSPDGTPLQRRIGFLGGFQPEPDVPARQLVSACGFTTQTDLEEIAEATMRKQELVQLADLLAKYVEHARMEKCERGVAEANTLYKRVNKEARGREHEVPELAGVR